MAAQAAAASRGSADWATPAVYAGEPHTTSNGSAAQYGAAPSWAADASQYPYGAAYDQTHYQQAGYGQAGYVQTGYAENSYGQTGYVQMGYGQGQQAMVSTPQTVEEAMRTPYGRPPIAVLSFSIGGRVAVMLPKTSVRPSTSSACVTALFPAAQE
jgi:hypothetical protein